MGSGVPPLLPTEPFALHEFRSTIVETFNAISYLKNIWFPLATLQKYTIVYGYQRYRWKQYNFNNNYHKLFQTSVAEATSEITRATRMPTWDHWIQRNDFYGWAGSLRFDSCGVLLSVLSVGFRKLDATTAYRTPNWTRAFKCVFSFRKPWNCSVKNEESIQRSSVQQISAWTKWWEHRCTLN